MQIHHLKEYPSSTSSSPSASTEDENSKDGIVASHADEMEDRMDMDVDMDMNGAEVSDEEKEKTRKRERKTDNPYSIF